MPQKELNDPMATIASILAAPIAEREQLLMRAMSRADAYADPAVWIARLAQDQVMQQWSEAKSRAAAGAAMPLLGVPFAVKDNIDVAGLPTTAGCPDFTYTPEQSATCVHRLMDAGAILIGKTNLDQFATGLVGTRSPYGACRNALDPSYISGGSSSGSAVAVAAGLVSFALGTDTAGSGRIPAGFNNIVGLKPTRGYISTHCVVPACRSLDCVSIFALTCDDAAAVLRVVAGHDAHDSFSRSSPLNSMQATLPQPFRFGVPRRHLQFFGNDEYASLYEAAAQRMQWAGGVAVEIDFTPFADAAALLYGGPWVAERYAAISSFIKSQPNSLLPVTRSIIEKASQISAVETFEAMYELAWLKSIADEVWKSIDLMLLPTAGTIYTHEQVAAEPIQLNTNLGYYTNFVNLLDYSAIAVPSGFTSHGLPFGVTLVAPAWCDGMLARLGSKIHIAAALALGTGTTTLATHDGDTPESAQAPLPGFVRLAVLGAHLSGQPLNWQLTQRGGTLMRTCRTAPIYRFYALANSAPAKPGILRVGDGQTGHAIEVELWDIPHESLGSFVDGIPSPLGIGTLTLEDDSTVKGFICEPFGLTGATDISHHGGWRAYLSSISR